MVVVEKARTELKDNENEAADEAVGLSVCLRSEVLRSLRHYLREQSGKDVTPSIAWRRQVWREEALDDLP